MKNNSITYSDLDEQTQRGIDDLTATINASRDPQRTLEIMRSILLAMKPGLTGTAWPSDSLEAIRQP